MRLFLDFETYYDKQYSLTKMSPLEYVLDPRFQVLGCAFAIDDQPGFWLQGQALDDYITSIEWPKTEIVAHNASFDGLILTMHYKVRAARYYCTVNMARALLPISSHSLKSVASILGHGAKTDGLTEGSHATDQVLIDYAINDVELCRKIYNDLNGYFATEEMYISHLTTRWSIEPELRIDMPRMQQAAEDAVTERNRLMSVAALKYGITEKELTSNPMFAAWLANNGMDVPMKESPTTGMQVPALSKNDPEFHDFIADNMDYKDLFDARIAAKSNIGYRRPQKILDIAKLTAENLIPFPLKYWGAGTSRWAGLDFNPQNLPRKSEMRKSIIAPPGHLIVVADASQIELRINAWYSGEAEVLGHLRNERDLYRIEAARQFSKPIEEVTDDERQFGKLVTLGLGYGMGFRKFRLTCASGPMGMKPFKITEDRAKEVVTSYREAHPNIVKSWHEQEKALYAMANGAVLNIHPMKFEQDIAILPNGMALHYQNLFYDGDQWLFRNGGPVTRIYPAKLQENIVQALARMCLSYQMISMEREGMRIVGSVHDEVLLIAREDEAERTLKRVIEIMSTPPEWAAGLPLAAKGDYDKCYSK